MNRSASEIPCLAAVLFLGGLFSLPVLAQGPAALPLSLTSNSASATPNLPRPVIKSPVAFFRELLAMNFIERNKFLTNRSPEDRKLIFAKLREYESLKPDQRELRLRVTELRWYLLLMMRAPAANRTARLALIPVEQRELLEARLEEWDKLPPDVQQELLDNEAAISYFTELEATGRRPAAGKMPPGIEQWQALNEDQREKIMARFNQFFDLRPKEKEKALNTLSESERRQIEKTLRKFGELPPAKRIVCIHSFEKFTELSLEDRQQFLKNAERWKLMTPEERQAWRDLVSRISVSPTDSIHIIKLPRPPKLPPRAPAVASTNN